MTRVVGVAGAGAMGAGVARLAARSGAHTLWHDPDAATLERGVDRIRGELDRAADERLRPVAEVDALAPCDVVLEAVPERPGLERALLGTLAAAVSADCVLATGAASRSVTELAAGLPRPERVVGLRFFGAPALARAVELVAGEESGAAALRAAAALAEAMGRHVVRAADVPGFLLDRCHHPFVLEPAALVTEGLADAAGLDRIARLGGGFAQGPFERADDAGLDVVLHAAESLWARSYGEPRWRPSPLLARMVAAGRLGRESGRGFHDYRHGAHRPEDPPAPSAEPGGLVVIAGELGVAHDLRLLADDAGWDVRLPEEAEGAVPELILDCGAQPEDGPLQGGPQALLLADGSLARLDPGGGSVGFHALPPLEPGGLVELTRGRDSSAVAARAAERFFASCELHVEWVGDAPGLVLGRIVGQLVNEAAFALGEGVGGAEDIDAGMVLGRGHPHGPLAWADLIGLDHVLAVLDALADERREERYRAAPLLRRLVAEGRTGVLAGEGFHRHD